MCLFSAANVIAKIQYLVLSSEGMIFTINTANEEQQKSYYQKIREIRRRPSC